MYGGFSHLLPFGLLRRKNNQCLLQDLTRIALKLKVQDEFQPVNIFDG